MSERSELPPRLGDLLGAVGARAGIADSRATGILWAKWPEIVGDTVANNAEPTSLRDGVLRVRTTTPTWATELTYLAGEIKARANELVGAEVVREVRVWTGPGPVNRATPNRRNKQLDEHHASAQADQASGEAATGPADVHSALERARAAWFRRRFKRG